MRERKNEGEKGIKKEGGVARGRYRGRKREGGRERERERKQRREERKPTKTVDLIRLSTAHPPSLSSSPL